MIVNKTLHAIDIYKSSVSMIRAEVTRSSRIFVSPRYHRKISIWERKSATKTSNERKYNDFVSGALN